MKKIVDNIVYDTDTANEISYDVYSVDDDDYEKYSYYDYYCSDRIKVIDVISVLYKNKTGEYFLHNNFGFEGDECIVPLSLNEAKIWMEEHATVREYLDEFVEVAEQ